VRSRLQLKCQQLSLSRIQLLTNGYDEEVDNDEEVDMADDAVLDVVLDQQDSHAVQL